MNATITQLPRNFFGKEDAIRLESFGAYLIEHGSASQWRWQRSDGIDIAFLIYRGASCDELLVEIGRSASEDVYFANDSHNRRLMQGSLEEVMSAVDAHLGDGRSDDSA